MTRILIVDDEPQILRALRINLQARQYEVVTAADGADALHAAAADHPDLVVLDLGLPDIDGVEVIRKLRAWTPVPIIVLSGRTGQRRQGRRPRRRRRRLRHQALQHRRTARPHPRRHPPTAQTPTPPPTVRIGRYTVDLADRRRQRRAIRPGGAPDPHRVAAAGGPGAQPRQAGQPAPAAARGLGSAPTSRETHYLRQYMTHLRRKLEADPARPRHLLTEPGMGYRFQAIPDSQPAISDPSSS